MLLVMPQATRGVRPKKTAGSPAYAVPATSNEPPERCASYQHETAPKAMWGSLATIGLPDAVRVPATTQLLLPRPSSGSPPAPAATRPPGSTPHPRAGQAPGGPTLPPSAAPS